MFKKKNWISALSSQVSTVSPLSCTGALLNITLLFSVCCFLSLYRLFIIFRLRIGVGPFILCQLEQLGMINRGHWRLCGRKWRAGRSRSSVSLPTHGLLRRHGNAARNLEDKALGCHLCLKGPGFSSAVCFLLGFLAACLWDLESEN